MSKLYGQNDLNLNVLIPFRILCLAFLLHNLHPRAFFRNLGHYIIKTTCIILVTKSDCNCDCNNYSCYDYDYDYDYYDLDLLIKVVQTSFNNLEGMESLKYIYNSLDRIQSHLKIFQL